MRLAVLWLCLCPVLAGAAGDATTQVSDVDRFMKEVVAKWKVANGAVAVARHGRLILAQGYGAARDGMEQRAGNTIRAVEERGGDQLDSGALVLRGVAAGVDVVVLCEPRPTDRAFEAEVADGIGRIASGIKQWPAVDLFVKGPELSEQDVVSAADFTGGRVVAGETVILFPANAGPPQLAQFRLTKDGRLANSIGETRVLFDDVPATMVYAVNGQICAVVPYAVAHKGQTQVVVEYRGERSAPVMLPVARTAPAMFTLDLSGGGQAAMLNEMGCCNSPHDPAMRGSVVALYATGEGQTRPAGIDGRVAANPRIAGMPAPRLPVRVTVGGIPAEILYAAEAPHMVGSLQVNIRIPAKAPIGDGVPLVLTVGGVSSRPATMAIRSRTQSVLVADQDSDAGTRLEGILRRAGYEVFVAHDKERARAIAQEHRLDLIVAGIGGQQDLNGWAAENPPVKLIAAARTLGPETLRAADLLGAQGILTEPFQGAAVRRKVHEILRSHPVPYAAAEPGPRLPMSGRMPSGQ